VWVVAPLFSIFRAFPLGSILHSDTSKTNSINQRFVFYGFIPLLILQALLLLASAVGVVAMLCTKRSKSTDEGGMTPIKEAGAVPAYEMDYRSGKQGAQIHAYNVAWSH
jgi:hypothetical protein